MSFLQTAIAWLKDAVRGVHLDPVHFDAGWQQPEQAAEVEDQRERYSAARYVQCMRAAMNGDRSHFKEWQRHIHALSPEDYGAFMWEVDLLIMAGRLTAVLTDEQMAEVKERVLERKDEIIAMTMPTGAVPVATMHEIINGTYKDEDGMDEDGLPAWPELEEFGGDDDFSDLQTDSNAWPEDVEDADIGTDEEAVS